MINPWPEAYLIGAIKTGSTSLHTFFRQHRGFSTSVEKYQRYFARELHPAFCWGDNEAQHQQLYLTAFASGNPASIRVDCDVTIMQNSEAANRIARVRPDARIMAVLRDPVERAWSHYLMNYERGLEDRTPDQAFFGQPEPKPGMSVPEKYLDAGLYYKNIRPFVQNFKTDNILLLRHEDLKFSADDVQRRICNFLQVAEDPTIRLADLRENQSRVARDSLARSILRLRHGTVGRWLRNYFPQALRSTFTGVVYKTGKTIAIPAGLRVRLVKYYEADVALLKNEFRMDVSHWLNG